MWNLLMLTNDVRHICHGRSFIPVRQDAYRCLEQFRHLLRGELGREATDVEVRDSVDLMFKDLMLKVTHASQS